MALKAGYKGIKEVGPGLDYDNTTGLLTLEGESSLKLDNLEDVTIDTPLGGDVLQYDSSNDEWTNETPDTEPIEDSPQLITSGAVYAGLKTEDDKISAIWSSNAKTGVHNLLENKAVSKTVNTATCTVEGIDKHIVISTSAPISAYSELEIIPRYKSLDGPIKAGQEYILSGCMGGADNTYYLFVTFYNSSDNSLGSIFSTNGETQFTVPNNAVKMRCAIGMNSGVELDNQMFYPMIRFVTDTDSTYAPHAQTNLELTQNKVSYNFNARTGVHQLLPVTLADIKKNNTTGTWSSNAYTVNGLTFDITADSNGYVSEIDVDGTPSAFTSFFLFTWVSNFLIKDGDLKLRGCPVNGSNNCRLVAQFNTSAQDAGADGFSDTGDGITLPKASVSKSYMRSYIVINEAVSHKKFYPLITVPEDTDTSITPYAMTNRELTEKVQGIIDAANNAADFAAFKTAIGNL